MDNLPITSAHDSQETKKKGNKEGLSCKVEVNTRFPKEKEHGRGNRGKKLTLHRSRIEKEKKEKRTSGENIGFP